MEEPIPLNKDFNPPVSSTPERNQRKNTSSAEKCCKRLQKEKAGDTSEETASRDEKIKDRSRKSEEFNGKTKIRPK